MEVKITAIVLAKNEEKVIAECLESLSWTNEILLVDSGSTDKTIEIASNQPPPKSGWWIIPLVALLGAVGLYLAHRLGRDWAFAGLMGWSGASVLGLAGWLTNHRAFAAKEQKRFLKLLFGGMLARLLFCGVFVMVVVGTGWLPARGFAAGLLAGIGLFLLLEIRTMLKWLKPESKDTHA